MDSISELMVLVIIVMVCFEIDQQQKSISIREAQYFADPLYSFEKFINNRGAFMNILRFEPHVFVEHILCPLIDEINLPRQYFLRDDYTLYGFVDRMRPCQIEQGGRVVRFMMAMRGIPVSMLAHYFDQHFTTCYRDVHHIAQLMVDKMGSSTIKPIVLGSTEYFQKLGQRAFRHFPCCLYATDVVKCGKRRPAHDGHVLYFDGYKRQYGYGFLVTVDCDGLCRSYCGHTPGSINDISSWYYSEMATNPTHFLGPNGKILADGIFANIEADVFITPVCYTNRPLTVAEERFNLFQSWDRSIVEHYFSRLKLLFPVLNHFTFGEDSINYFFASGLIMNNVMIKHQCPLRK